MRVELQEFWFLVMCVISKFKENGITVFIFKKKENAEITMRCHINGII